MGNVRYEWQVDHINYWLYIKLGYFWMNWIQLNVIDPCQNTEKDNLTNIMQDS